MNKLQARFREVLASINTMPKEYERVQAILNIGNETKSEKEERKKMVQELRYELMPNEERDRVEYQRKKTKKLVDGLLKHTAKVFYVDVEKKVKLLNISIK